MFPTRLLIKCSLIKYIPGYFGLVPPFSPMLFLPAVYLYQRSREGRAGVGVVPQQERNCGRPARRGPQADSAAERQHACRLHA